MSVFGDAWAYLADGGNWTGNGGMLELLVQQLLLTGAALALALVIGLPLALWLGHIGRGGFLAINISNIGRAIPTFALLALLVTAEWPGVATFGPYGRAGIATLIALTLFALPPIITNSYVAVREVGDDVKEAARGMGMTGLAAVPPGRAAAGAAAGGVGRPARPRAGVGDGHHRRTGGGAGPRRGSSPPASPNTNYGKGIAGAVVVAVVAMILELLAALGAARRRPPDPARGAVPSYRRRRTTLLATA